MALSPEELKIVEYGKKQGKSQEQVLSAISKYRETASANTPNRQNQSTNTDGWQNAKDLASGAKQYTSGLVSDYGKDAQSFVDTAKRGIENYNAIPKDQVFKRTGALLGTGLQQAGNAVNTIFQPFTTAVTQGINYVADKESDSRWLQNIAQTDGVGKMLDTVQKLYGSYDAFAKAHPEMSRNLEAGLNTALAVSGSNSLDKTVSEALINPIKSTYKNTANELSGIKSGVVNTVSDAKNSIGDGINMAKNKIIPPKQEFYSSIDEAQKILNPDGYYTPTEKGNAYLKGNVEVKGKGIFQKEVIKPQATTQTEALAQLVDEGKISAKNLPSQNIEALGREARATDMSIDEFVNKPELNKPFNQNTINKTLNNLEKTAADNLTFVTDTTEQKAYQQVLGLAKQEIAKNPYNMAGLRKSIKSFNARMERILGQDIYSGASESVGNARLQAVKDTRTTLNNFLADNLESAPVGGRLPAKTTMNGKAVGGQMSEKTRVQGGGVYKAQLQKEAQLLNAKNEIAYRSRGTLGKTKAQKFLKKHPAINKAANIVENTAGLTTGLGLLK